MMRCSTRAILCDQLRRAEQIAGEYEAIQREFPEYAKQLEAPLKRYREICGTLKARIEESKQIEEVA